MHTKPPTPVEKENFNTGTYLISQLPVSIIKSTRSSDTQTLTSGYSYCPYQTMEADSNLESDLPHQRRQLRERRLEIYRQLKRISDEVASEEAGQTTSLEASEQEAAASREERWQELCNELDEIRNTGRARRTSVPPRLNGDSGWEQGQAIRDSPQQSSPPHVGDLDSLSPGTPTQPASRVENSLQSTDSLPLSGTEVDHTTGVGDEGDASGDPSATFSSIRWISREDLGEPGRLAQGITLYRSEVTDAIYFLNDLDEKVWLVDENGDCVIAQDQNPDWTTKSSKEETVR